MFTMKIKILFAMLFALIFSSCAKENKEVSEASNTMYDYDKIGILHNNGLDSIYKNINKQIHDAKDQNKTIDIRETTKMVTINYINSCKTPPLFEAKAVKNINELYSNRESSLKSTIVDANGFEALYSVEILQSLTSMQKKILDDLNVVLSDTVENEAILQSRIQSLEKVANMLLSSEDQFIILSATAVAKHTIEYWFANTDRWAQLGVMSLPQQSAMRVIQHAATPRKFSWKKVAKGDVAGAVRGAANWGGAAIFGGPATWAAFGAATGSWAAGCSAYEAAIQLLDRW